MGRGQRGLGTIAMFSPLEKPSIQVSVSGFSKVWLQLCIINCIFLENLADYDAFSTSTVVGIFFAENLNNDSNPKNSPNAQNLVISDYGLALKCK